MRKYLPLFVISAIVAVGCGGGDSASTASPASAVPAAIPAIPADLITPEAGVPIDPFAPAGLPEYQAYAATRNFGRRPDPFALLSPEARFEKLQQGARVIDEFGANPFGTVFEEPERIEERPPELEPQPYRRLVGVLLGDGVSALIQMEDGRVYDIRPGNRVANTDWVVVSIDSERAILRRSGNRLPKEIIVRLEPNLAGGGGTANPPAGGGGAGGGGGAPGAAGASPEMAPN